jgi:hypothetical protein
MANSYKNIVITPNIGSNSDPKILFSGANTSSNTDIALYVYPADNGSLSFEGSAGQLFSITNRLDGTIFSVNDVSGIPSIEVEDTGTISLARFSGNVGIGTANANAKLQVSGSVTATSFNSTSGFFENSPNITANYTVVASKNAMSAGPVTINSGITVTIETGARWVVL